MVLIKSKPEALLNDRYFPKSFNSIFNSFFDDSIVRTDLMNFMPQADIIEKEKQFEIRMSLPGIKKEDVKISLDGEMLNVEGERKHEINKETDKFVRRELSYGKFSRSFNIGKYDSGKIEASFENGILNITVPKSVEEKISTIEIK